MGFNTPLSVLIMGGIVGILVFAVSSAFTVWLRRNQSASELPEQPASLPASLLKLASSVVVVIVIVAGFNALQPRTLLDQEGLLVGKDLFTVRSRAGFIAEYPPLELQSTATTVEFVAPGKALVILRRSPDPREIAAASQQRELLQEQLNIERTRRTPVDPTLHNQLNALERRLDSLNQREKDLIKQRENSLREDAKNNPATHSEYRQVEQQLLTVDAEQKQTVISLHQAETEMHAASEMLARGLISQREKVSRVSSYNVLQSKLDELRERARLLEQEKAAIRASLTAARQHTREQLVDVDRWLMEVKTARQQTLAEHNDVSKRLREESILEHARHSSRIRQLELQLGEANTLLSSPESPPPIEVTAPWHGYIGYRDLSPASLRPDTGPLVVLYKPEHIWVELQASITASATPNGLFHQGKRPKRPSHKGFEKSGLDSELLKVADAVIRAELQIPHIVARDLTRDNTQITLFIHGTPATRVEFPGHLESKLPLPDEKKVALRISTTPPPALVRKLALGEEVQVQVHISSTGFSIASLLKQVPVSLLTSHVLLQHAGIPFVPIMVSLCVVIITILALRNKKRATSTKIVVSNTKNGSFITTDNDRLEHSTRLYSHPYTNGAQTSDLQRGRNFIFDFTDVSSDKDITQLDLSSQAVSHTREDIVLLQIQRIVGEYKKMTQAIRPVIAQQKQSPMKDRPEYSFHDWRTLGVKLNRDILTNEADLNLLTTLYQQLAQRGIWVTPFIASALSPDIHADMLLGYSLELCIKRLSAVQHKVELGQAICDLAQYLCVLQLFFPALVKQIVPSLQQGLMMALHIATAEMEAETEADHLLTMLREILSTFSNNRLDVSLDVE